MAAHRFNLGQRLEFVAGRPDASTPRGSFTITRLLPNDGGDREYRIRHDRDGHERVVRETQMRPSSDPLG